MLIYEETMNYSAVGLSLKEIPRHVDYAHALMCANAVVLSFRVTRRM